MNEIERTLQSEVIPPQEHTPEPWWVGPTPAYLRMGQGSGNKQPLTIRSPHHSEEIATVWTALLPTEANAARIVACVNACAGMSDPEAEIARLRRAVGEAP